MYLKGFISKDKADHGGLRICVLSNNKLQSWTVYTATYFCVTIFFQIMLQMCIWSRKYSKMYFLHFQNFKIMHSWNNILENCILYCCIGNWSKTARMRVSFLSLRHARCVFRRLVSWAHPIFFKNILNFWEWVQLTCSNCWRSRNDKWCWLRAIIFIYLNCQKRSFFYKLIYKKSYDLQTLLEQQSLFEQAVLRL